MHFLIPFSVVESGVYSHCGDVRILFSLQANEDYRLAVESQDAEYARVLEEKEKERLRKAKDKYKAMKEAGLLVSNQSL